MGKNDFRCLTCGGRTREDHVKLCLWDSPTEAVIIEDVRARICVDCYGQFYDEATTFEIERLRIEEDPDNLVKRTINVPVFSLSGRAAPENKGNA